MAKIRRREAGIGCTLSQPGLLLSLCPGDMGAGFVLVDPGAMGFSAGFLL